MAEEDVYANAGGPKTTPISGVNNCSWFHGNISRIVAENLVKENGQFLVRESGSVTSYVVTCKWNGKHLHVLIKQSSINGLPTYGFEMKFFASVPELIIYYKENQLPVTQTSGAILYNAVAVLHSHDYYNFEAKSEGGKAVKEKVKKPNKKEESKKKPLSKVDKLLSRLRMDKSNTLNKWGSAPMLSPELKSSPEQPELIISAASCMNITEECPLQQRRKAPTKPARSHNTQMLVKKSKPVVEIRNQQLYEDDGKDYTDYAQLSSIPFFIECKRLEKKAEEKAKQKKIDEDKPELGGDSYLDMTGASNESPNHSKESLKEYDGGPVYARQITVEDNLKMWRASTSEEILQLEAHSFKSLPLFTKPLESDKLPKVVQMLLPSDPSLVAWHLFQQDANLLLFAKKDDFPPGIECYLEMIEIPCAVNLRAVLRDRHESLKYFIIASIVTFEDTKNRWSRKDVLVLWIEVARQLWDKFLDTFALDTIVCALFSDQIQSLASTFCEFREDQSCIESLKMYNDLTSRWHRRAGAVSAHNRCLLIPSLQSRVVLTDATLEELFAHQTHWPWNWQGFSEILEPIQESSESLSAARHRAQKLLDEHVPDEALMELSQTESFMKILWGPRGAQLPHRERYRKMEAILAQYACKAELEIL